MAMNLIQVQNRLRDLPASDPRSMQMLTAFANGQNPQVPPFIALAELNRRKQLAQKQAQPPEATVKDKIEQEAKMMQTNAGRQQEAMQNMGQQAMMTNAGKIPASTPQTQGIEEENFAAGGIANLNSQFDFAGGGIVAFSGKDGSKVEDENKERDRKQLESDQESLSDMLTKLGAAGKDILTLPGRAAAGVLNAGVIRPARAISGYDIPYIFGSTPDYVDSMTPFYDKISAAEDKTKAEAKAKTENKPGANLNVDEKAKVETPAMTPEEKVRMLTGNRTPAGAPVGGGTRPAGGAPAGGKMYDLLLKQIEGDTFKAGPDYETVMAELMAKNPDMQGKAGGKFETLIEEIRRQDIADRAENKAIEEARQSNRFLDVISGAGRSLGKFKDSDQRGKSGVLNLLGGIGQQYRTMGEEDVQRSKEQKALERQQNMAYAQMISSIEDVRRAEARGDAKEIVNARNAAALAERNFKNTRTENLFKGATAEESIRSNRERENIQRASNSIQGRDLIRERAAVLALDRANQGKTPTELLQMAATLGTGVQAENAETARFKAVAAAWKDSPDGKQEMLAAFKPESKEYKNIMIKKDQFFKNSGVNLGGITGGGGGGSTVDLSQYTLREKGSK
jgi:hypothetical protein